MTRHKLLLIAKLIKGLSEVIIKQEEKLTQWT